MVHFLECSKPRAAHHGMPACQGIIGWVSADLGSAMFEPFLGHLSAATQTHQVVAAPPPPPFFGSRLLLQRISRGLRGQNLWTHFARIRRQFPQLCLLHFFLESSYVNSGGWVGRPETLFTPGPKWSRKKNDTPIPQRTPKQSHRVGPPSLSSFFFVGREKCFVLRKCTHARGSPAMGRHLSEPFVTPWWGASTE